MWIFAGAPYIEWMTHQPRLKGALGAVTAAVVGVILNLAVWFALHVFFAKVTLVQAGPLQLWTPALSSIDPRVVVLSAIAGFLLLKQHASVPVVLAIASALALAMRFAGV
jgi:chromate transporter